MYTVKRFTHGTIKKYSSLNNDAKYDYNNKTQAYSEALINVKSRIIELNRLSQGGDHKAVLNDILKEIQMSLDKELD